MASKDDIIADLRRLVDTLTQEVAELRLQLAKANKDSSNSSKSPSSDITGAGKNRKKNKPGRPKKRTAGGQPGRVRKLRDRLPADRVDEVVEHELCEKDIKRLGLIPTKQFDVIQAFELPDSPVIVTEHRFRLYQSPDGDIYIPSVPEVQGQPMRQNPHSKEMLKGPQSRYQ